MFTKWPSLRIQRILLSFLGNKGALVRERLGPIEKMISNLFAPWTISLLSFSSSSKKCQGAIKNHCQFCVFMLIFFLTQDLVKAIEGYPAETWSRIF